MTFKGSKQHFLSNFFMFYLGLLKIEGCNQPFLKINGCNCTRCTRSNGTPATLFQWQINFIISFQIHWVAYIQLVRLNLREGIFVRDHFECVLSLGGHQFAVDCISPRGPQRCPQSIRHPLLKKCRANRQKLPQLYTTVDNSVSTVKKFHWMSEILD